jgi:predicted Zn-dependent peptidase
MLDILCDIMRPALREEDFEMEKGVILEEIAMYEDRPHFRLMDNIMRQHFGEHPMGNSILGTNESITALRRDNMLDYFARRYAPSNVILTAVGNVDFDALVAQADSLCGGWDDYDVSRDTTDEPGTHTSATMVDQRLARQNIAFLSHAPSAQSDDRYAAELLATVIGDATGSRLYYALIEPAIADEASVSYSSADGTGVLMTMLSCDPDRSGEAVAIARDELQTFATDGPTDAELQAAKNKIASTDTIKGELPMGRLTSVGFEWQYRRDYQTLPQQIEQLFAVTREDIIDVARRYAITQATILALGPQENPLP